MAGIAVQSSMALQNVGHSASTGLSLEYDRLSMQMKQIENDKTLSDKEKEQQLAQIEQQMQQVAAEGSRILGYASLSPYRSRAAYDATVEVSVYIKEENRGQGLGTTLMKRIIDIAREEPEIHNVVSFITAENEVSCILHEHTGYTLCGTIQDAGRKFGRYLNVNIYQLLV